VHQLDNKVFDIIDARCNHEDWRKTRFLSFPPLTAISTQFT